jgi:hypothetical protein
MLLKVVSLRPTEKMGWHGFTLPNATGHRAARALRPTLKAAKPPAAAGKEPLPVVPVPIWLFDLKDMKDLSDHCDRYIPLPCDVITQPATGAPCSQEAPSLGHPTSSSVPQPLDQGVEVTEASAKQVRNCYIYIHLSFNAPLSPGATLHFSCWHASCLPASGKRKKHTAGDHQPEISSWKSELFMCQLGMSDVHTNLHKLEPIIVEDPIMLHHLL